MDFLGLSVQEETVVVMELMDFQVLKVSQELQASVDYQDDRVTEEITDSAGSREILDYQAYVELL